jgi:glycine/D-amino acid oxidase-like deaminating enzyme
VRSTVARTAAVPGFFPGNAACADLAIRRREDGGYTLAPCFNEHLINRDSFLFMRSFAPALKDVWNDMKLRFGNDAPGGIWPARKWRSDEVSPFEKSRVLNPLPTESTLTALKTRFERRLPGIKNVHLEQSWAGMIDATPDVVPVIDQLENFPGLFLGSGFSGHGFGIGPAAGRILADLIQGRDPGHDMTRFRSTRFADGSRLVKGPSL